MTLQEKFNFIRQASENLCKPLITEDYSIQPSEFASPPKWHLAHVTWFWEQFVLTPHLTGYAVFNDNFSFLFNSYYNNVGKRVLRPVRGLMTRPSVDEVYAYRAHVNAHMNSLFEQELSAELRATIEIGLNHEQQHQELLVYDIKYILGNQPTFPAYSEHVFTFEKLSSDSPGFHAIEAGIYEIGHDGDGFAFDNEFGRHKTYIQDFEIADRLVSNSEFLEFMKAGGYSDFNFWHDEGWQWVTSNQITAPLYWHEIDGKWHCYDLAGLQEVAPDEPVKHISFYEAFAFAQWKGMRLPTEFEWEVASSRFNWGQLWEWTNSAYLAYPGYVKQEGAIGEYNGKFMVNQMVLRGASVATPKGHSRETYRNFFHPNMRWQYNGIRLAK